MRLPRYLQQQAEFYRYKKARAQSDRQLARGLGLTAFKQTIYRRYTHADHLDALDNMLTQVSLFIESGGTEGIGRGMIFMPPRHGKSLTTSRLYPPWHLGRNPDHRIILTSYGATLAEQHSRAARNLIAAPIYGQLFPGVRLSDDSRAAAAWNIGGHEGGMDAVGVGGGITGKGAQLIIGDDTVKSRAVAESRTYQEALWDWYTNDLYTRLEPGGAILLMMTRWHEKDLAGMVLASDTGSDWTVLSLPAIAEDDDPIGRKPGAALWPERFPVDVLEETRATIGAYAWASLYQQRPQPAEGGLFKWEWFERPGFRVETPPPLAKIVIAIDPAATANEHSDETGIIGAGVAMIDGKLHGFILDDLTLKASPDGWGRQAIAGLHKHRGHYIVIETNQGGDMVRHTLHTIDPNVKIKEVRAGVSKQLRAEPIAALYEQGRVHHVGYFPFLEEQMCRWVPSKSRHSPDRLDAAVWALSELLLRKEPGKAETF